MEKTATEEKGLVNDFAEEIIFLPKEETSEELFYGGFRPFAYSDVRANLITTNPVRNLINGALMSLPEKIRENFPSNLKKRLKEIGKSVGNPRFPNQFTVKSELHIDYSRKYRWTQMGNGTISLFEDEHRELREVIKAGFIVRLKEFHEDDICFVSEDLIQKQKDPVKRILELWRLPDSRGVIDGKNYLAISNSFPIISSFVPYFQIYAIHLKTYACCKNGGDAVHHIEVRLPELEVLKDCPSWAAADMQWETMKEEAINQHASFEEAVKELISV